MFYKPPIRIHHHTGYLTKTLHSVRDRDRGWILQADIDGYGTTAPMLRYMTFRVAKDNIPVTFTHKALIVLLQNKSQPKLFAKHRLSKERF